MRICGSGQRVRQTDGNEPMRAPDRIQLHENAAFELVGGCKRSRGLGGGGRAHGAHAEERKRADSHKRKDPTSHIQAIGCSASARDH